MRKLPSFRHQFESCGNTEGLGSFPASYNGRLIVLLVTLLPALTLIFHLRSQIGELVLESKTSKTENPMYQLESGSGIWDLLFKFCVRQKILFHHLSTFVKSPEMPQRGSSYQLIRDQSDVWEARLLHTGTKTVERKVVSQLFITQAQGREV